jgi:hypothetical protein
METPCMTCVTLVLHTSSGSFVGRLLTIADARRAVPAKALFRRSLSAQKTGAAGAPAYCHSPTSASPPKAMYFKELVEVTRIATRTVICCPGLRRARGRPTILLVPSASTPEAGTQTDASEWSRASSY